MAFDNVTVDLSLAFIDYCSLEMLASCEYIKKTECQTMLYYNLIEHGDCLVFNRINVLIQAIIQ